jgi:hypothetical protein
MIHVRALIAGLALATGLLLAAPGARAASDYYGPVSIANIPALWVYTPGATPVGNKLKICYPSGTTLGCSAAISGFTTAPGIDDDLQYRIVAANGALWIVDLTAANATSVLCEAVYNTGNSTFHIACTQGTGIK